MTNDLVIALITAAGAILAAIVSGAAAIYAKLKRVADRTDKYHSEINGRMDRLLDLVAKEAFEKGQESQEGWEDDSYPKNDG